MLLLSHGAWANDGKPDAPPSEEMQRRVSSAARDPLFFLKGSDEAWSIIDGKLGCLLASPTTKGGARLVMGHHPEYGRGLFLVGLALSVPMDKPDEPVVLAAGGRDLPRNGRMVARDLFFIPLSRTDIDLALRELWYAGALWVTVRQTAMSEGGLAVREAVEAYGKTCSVKDTSP